MKYLQSKGNVLLFVYCLYYFIRLSIISVVVVAVAFFITCVCAASIPLNVFMQLFEISAYPRTKPILLRLPAWRSSANNSLPLSLSLPPVHIIRFACTIIWKWRYKTRHARQKSPVEYHRIIWWSDIQVYCVIVAIIVFHIPKVSHTSDSIFCVYHFHTNKTKRICCCCSYCRTATAAFPFFALLLRCPVLM